MDIQDEIKKIYWSISEVATLFKVYPSKIRFYEDEFNIKVRKNKRGNRQFTKVNIELIGYIISLSKNMKLCGVKLIIEGKAKFTHL